MDENKLIAYAENVILLQDKERVVGFISHATVYGCEKLDSEAIARLIDDKFGEIARSMKRAGGG